MNTDNFPSLTVNGFDIKRDYSDKMAGFTLMELMIVIAIIATLAALSSILFTSYKDRSKYNQAVQDIQIIQDEIAIFEAVNDRFPLDLSEVNKDSLMDPWGNPYVYVNLSTVPKGKWRKDKSLVPINSTYDLSSMGPDGNTKAPLTAKASRDDIIRANDGGYIGRAADY